MSSQFEKRKAKLAVAADKDTAKQKEDVRAEAAGEPVYTQSGYDVFTSDGGRTYGVAEIAYNPATGDAKVNGIFSITRLVALKYANTKQALGILKK